MPSRAAANPLQVRFDPNAPSRGNVLEVAARGNDAPVALFDAVVCRDGDLTVKFRIDPKGSGAAGIVWRYRDAGNYYLLKFSAEQGMVRLLRVKNGVREPVALRNGKQGEVAVRQEITAGVWHLAKVRFRGGGIRTYLGNRRLFEAWDDGLSGEGKAGVVTSGPGVAAFDDFRIEKKVGRL